MSSRNFKPNSVSNNPSNNIKISENTDDSKIKFDIENNNE